LLNLSITNLPLSRVIRLARRFVVGALPDRFPINLDEPVMTRGSRRARDERVECRHAALSGSAVGVRRRSRLELPREAARRTHVHGYGNTEDRPTLTIDGLSWQVNKLRLTLSHHGHTDLELIDAWQLPDGRQSAA
jgi:hypothetical protein